MKGCGRRIGTEKLQLSHIAGAIAWPNVTHESKRLGICDCLRSDYSAFRRGGRNRKQRCRIGKGGIVVPLKIAAQHAAGITAARPVINLSDHIAQPGAKIQSYPVPAAVRTIKKGA